MGKVIRPIAESELLKEIAAEDLFTDREEPRKAFWNVYHAMEPGENAVIAYYGVGGIGKTTLIKKLGREIDEFIENGKSDHAFFSFEGKASKEEFLFNLSRQMMLSHKGKLEFPLLESAVLRIASEQGKDISQFEKKAKESILGNPLLDTAIGIGESFVPGLGTAKTAANVIEYLAKVGGRAWNEKEVSKGPYAIEYRNIKYLSSDELHRKLQEYFIKDAFEVFEKRQKPYVVFLDGYENLVSILNDGELSRTQDDWIGRPGDGLINIPNVLWVIAGREKINWNSEDLPEEHQHRVGDLSEKDADAFFEKAGISENLRKPLYELTHGTPVYMDVCVKTYRLLTRTKKPEIEDFGKDTSELAKRYLRDMDRDEQALMIMFSWFPNVFDMEMVDAVIDKLHYGAFRLLVEDILKLSLFERVSDSYRLHGTFAKITRDFSDKENGFRICNAVFEYLKGSLLEADRYMFRTDKLWQLFETLDKAENLRLSNEEMYKMLDIVEEEAEYSGDYYVCEEMLGRLFNMISGNEYTDEVIIKAQNLRNYNFYRAGIYSEMKKNAEETYSYAQKVLGEEHTYTQEALYNMSVMYYALGDLDKSLETDIECYNIRKRTLGEEHPDTVRSLNAIGVDYSELGEYEKAKEIDEKVYDIRKRTLGEEHPDTLTSLNGLGVDYSDLGDFEKAKAAQEKCYELRKIVLGEEHPDTIWALGTLGNACLSLGNYEKARDLLEHCFNSDEHTLGFEHPDTLVALHNLANAYSKLGNYIRAQMLQEKCYEARVRILGPEHPDTLMSLLNLAGSFCDLKKYVRAKELCDTGMEISRRTLGDEHPCSIAYESLGLRCAAAISAEKVD